jgi:hypothetical protein
MREVLGKMELALIERALLVTGGVQAESGTAAELLPK